MFLFFFFWICQLPHSERFHLWEVLSQHPSLPTAQRGLTPASLQHPKAPGQQLYFLKILFYFIHNPRFKPLAFKRSLPLCSRRRACILFLGVWRWFSPPLPVRRRPLCSPPRVFGFFFPLPGGKRGCSAPGTSVS